MISSSPVPPPSVALGLVGGAALMFLSTSCRPQHPPRVELENKEAQPGQVASPQRPPLPKHRGQTVIRVPDNPTGAEVARRMQQRERYVHLDTSDEPADLIAEFAMAEPERREEILAILGASEAPEAWDFLCRQAVSSEPDLRLAALDALALHGGGDPTEVISACLDFPDEVTRTLAVTLLGKRVRSHEVWARAATDPSPAVRLAYLSAVEDAPESVRLAAARAALTTEDPQLRVEAASVLGGVRRKEAVAMLIPLLDDAKAAGVAADGMFYFFGRGFNSAAEANAWWLGQAANYRDDLESATED